MRKILFILTGTLLSIIQLVDAQDQEEALRFSQKFYPSNARSLGMGNAIGAVGANALSASINPAGIGLYRKSDFTISTSLSNIMSETSYLGSSVSDPKYNFNFSNLGLVLSNLNYKMGKPVQEGWVGYSLSLGMNRTNSFHKRQVFEGTNDKSSMLNLFQERANGSFPKEFADNSIELLAYNTYLIDPVFNIDNGDTVQTDQYLTAFYDTTNLSVRQQQSFVSKGASNDLYIGFGANYSNKLYLGGVLTFPTINNTVTKTFREDNLKDDPNYQSMEFKDKATINGTGIMAGIGLIYRPIDQLRLGASIFTPTFYGMSVSYSYDLSSKLKIQPGGSDGFDGTFDYTLTTPFRATGSAALIINKQGLISVDYEYINYATANLNSNDYDFINENRTIENIYRSVGNIRIGTEWRYEIFYFRGGFGYFPSPFNQGEDYVPSDADGSAKTYSFGLGFRQDKFTFDFAYQRIETSETFVPYTLTEGYSPQGTADISHNNFTFTFGMNF